MIIFIVTIQTLANSVWAANHYVTPAGAGSKNGSDWNNAYAGLPVSLARGAIYYIAAGTYGSYVFNNADSGASVITIKKATASDHGTNTGWSSSYGTGQAVWNGTLTFTTDNYVFDGQTRNESDWFSGSDYGFEIFGDEQQIRMGYSDTMTGPAVTNILVKDVYLRALDTGLSETVTGRRYGLDMDTKGGSGTFLGIVASRCFFQYGNVPIFTHSNYGFIVEYSAFADTQSTDANHGEAMSAYSNGNNGFIIRYNKFKAIIGTAVIAFTSRPDSGGTTEGFQIYGNVIWNCDLGDGAFGFDSADCTYTNNKIYNNTIIDKAGGYNQGIAIRVGTNNFVYNNLWVNCASSFWQGAGATYLDNAYSWNYSEPSAQTNVPTSIFVNYAGQDFRLASATTAGFSLPSPYNIDMLGNIRGADGTWDRGAYEYLQAIPVINAILPSGTNLIISGTNGSPNGHYLVLASTNLVLPRTNWTRLSTNSFNGSGNFIFTNPITPNKPGLFYLLQLQ